MIVIWKRLYGENYYYEEEPAEEDRKSHIGRVRICFVILFYITRFMMRRFLVWNLYRKVVQSEKKIIIIDNFSNNGTGEQLQNFIKDDEEIDVLINDKNLGFAKRKQ